MRDQTSIARNSRSRGAAERGSGTETAYTTLREMIVRGQLAPGSWVAESDLTSLLKMSRTPIRAALQWLQHEGYVLERGTGAKSKMMVAPLTVQDARELYAIVGAVEGIAGSHAAALSSKQRNSLVARLEGLHSAMVKTAASAAPDADLFTDTDTAFHDRIVEAGAGPRLLTIYKAIKPQTDRYWLLYAHGITGDMEISCTEHAAIVDALAGGDSDSTERALQANWANGAERLAKAIVKFGERGAW